MSEVCKVKGITKGNPPEYDWETYLNETARMILEQQTPNQILVVRSRLYELLVRLIPTNVIFNVSNNNNNNNNNNLLLRLKAFTGALEQGMSGLYNEVSIGKNRGGI